MSHIYGVAALSRSTVAIAAKSGSQAHLEELAYALGEVALVDKVLGQPQEEGAQRVGQLFGLALLDEIRLPLEPHRLAGPVEIFEEDGDADLEEEPVDEDDIGDKEEGRAPVDRSVEAHRRKLEEEPVNAADGDSEHGDEGPRESVEVIGRLRSEDRHPDDGICTECRQNNTNSTEHEAAETYIYWREQRL